VQPLACFFGREKTSDRPGATTVMLACLFYLNKFPRALGSSLVFSAGERQAMPGQSEAMARQSIALACLFYLKKVTSTA